MRNGEISYWWRAYGGFPPRRKSLPGPAEADVCIVGGGYTGLWTAYYLAGLNPALRIVVRMFNQSLADGTRVLLRDCAVLSESAIAAPGFVGAALGEGTPTHLRLAGRPKFRPTRTLRGYSAVPVLT